MSAELSEEACLFIHLLQKRLELSEEIARKVWAIVATWDKQQQRRQRFSAHLALLQTPMRPTAQAVLVQQLCNDWLEPDLLHDAIATLESQRRLSPPQAARLHLRIREATLPDGRWRDRAH